jgi:hypothetical protein
MAWGAPTRASPRRVGALQRVLTRDRAFRRLCDELGSHNHRRRRACLLALPGLDAVDADPDVWRLAADDPDPAVRLALLRTAAALSREPEPLVRYMATDPDRAVQPSAQNWLQAQIGCPPELTVSKRAPR